MPAHSITETSSLAFSSTEYVVCIWTYFVMLCALRTELCPYRQITEAFPNLHSTGWPCPCPVLHPLNNMAQKAPFYGPWHSYLQKSKWDSKAESWGEGGWKQHTEIYPNSQLLAKLSSVLQAHTHTTSALWVVLNSIARSGSVIWSLQEKSAWMIVPLRAACVSHVAARSSTELHRRPQKGPLASGSNHGRSEFRKH